MSFLALVFLLGRRDPKALLRQWAFLVGAPLYTGRPLRSSHARFSPGSFLFSLSLVCSLSLSISSLSSLSLSLSLSLFVCPLSLFLLRGASVENFGEQNLGVLGVCILSTFLVLFRICFCFVVWRCSPESCLTKFS